VEEVAEVAEVTEVAEAMALEESGKAEGAAAAMAVSVEAAMESMVVEEWWATVAAMAPAMVVRVVRATEVQSDRSTHMAYMLQASVNGAVVCETAQRFSNFFDLLQRLARDETISGAARECIEGWKGRLTMEKRHAGSRSRSDAVVTARVQLLQRMLDDLTSFAEVVASSGFGFFLAMES